MPFRRGHSDAVNIDANQMDASKIDVTIYQKHNKRFLFLQILIIVILNICFMVVK